ncbi:DUF4192 domain-containing protein [Nocardia terpenica]|uniref:DUF4192 domain-containing protein n=1 Tax=Nocardia terpenica TaxID=455432 RepID=UPI0018936EC2|nr:DUF4192 domain-containing protein [Nocardia terpenica]MBF6062056.1 DUF4192 domain-containing protein [Nocardia terpenica]MBF6106144.1 DUF4192 domain-containing protein [Nocardia terpenica]MBF6110476.1 DUF4192 domain-containing protein [Nocardia terpenica]MBF6120687.1 DUF4192 domain-containing protein [Nocardia terpenica]MBF6151812.1 DUF4192 domain-containing protein [Nocardia terpenica]
MGGGASALYTGGGVVGPRLRRALAAEGLSLLGGWATPSIGSGSPWWSLVGTAETGVIPDPEASPAALAAVLRGKQIHRSKVALEDLVRPDTTLADKVRKILSGRAMHDSDSMSSKGSIDDLVQQRRAQVSWLLRWVDVVASNAAPTPTAVAHCAVALRDKAVRDCVLALADTSKASAAQQLWAYLSRVLPDPDRAQAAALLAYHAYTTANGPLTRLALDAALRSDPEHAFTQLLDTALQIGMHPDEVGESIAEGACRVAAELGFDFES